MGEPAIDLNGPMPDHENNREAWLQWRRAGITSTASAAIMGESPFVDALKVYNNIVSGLALPEESSGRMRAGTRSEPWIVAEFEQRTGAKTRRQPAIVSKDFPWMRATVDRQGLTGHGELTMPDGSTWTPACPYVFEAKSTTERFYRKVKAEGPPRGWIVQATHAMIVWGYQFYVLALMSREDHDNFLYWVVEFRPELAAVIIDKTRAFWQDNVQARVPPVPGLPGGATEVPSFPGETAFFDDADFAGKVHRYETAKGEHDAALAELEGAKLSLKMHMEDAGAAVAEGAGYRFIWRETKPRRALDPKLVQAHSGSIFEAIREHAEADPGNAALRDLRAKLMDTFEDTVWVQSHLYKQSRPSRPFKPYRLGY